MATLTLAAPCALALSLLALPAGDDLLTVEKLEEIRDEVLADVEELRGGSFERTVDVKVTTKAGFIEYAKKRTESMQSAEQRSAESDIAKLTGVIPVDMDLEATMFDFLEGQVGGFYEPSEETFYVVDSFSEPGVLRVILVHELTHALDDQLFGIDETLGPLLHTNSDAAYAFHAVVEGSGTSVMNQWMVPKVMAGELSMADMQKAAGSTDFSGMPEYIWLPLLHSYLRGAAFLARSDNPMTSAMAKPPGEDIDAAFQNPPRSTEQILHPEKFWGDETSDEPDDIRLDVSGLDSSWSVLKEDTFGELGLSLISRAVAERQEFTALPEFTSDAAAGWGGDRYLLLGNGDARILHVATTWDSEADAEEFFEALDGVKEHLATGAKKFGKGSGGANWSLIKQDLRCYTIWAGVDEEAVNRVIDTLSVRVVRD